MSNFKLEFVLKEIYNEFYSSMNELHSVFIGESWTYVLTFNFRF